VHVEPHGQVHPRRAKALDRRAGDEHRAVGRRAQLDEMTLRGVD
jgi:hypothetical protein